MESQMENPTASSPDPPDKSSPTEPSHEAPLSFLPLPFGPGTGTPVVGNSEWGFF